MKLIIILVSLALDRYLSIGGLLRRFTWFDRYVVQVYEFLTKRSMWTAGKGWVATMAILLPIPLIVTIINCLFWHKLNGVGGFLIGVAVLVYCIGPEDLYAEVKTYKDAVQPESNSAKFSRVLTRAIFWQANERIFAVLFWFCVLGPFGALLYRLASLLRHAAERMDSPAHVLLPIAIQIHDALDWLPARLFSLGYGLAGNFVKSFSYWLDHVLSGLSNNREMLVECGQVAMDLMPGNNVPVTGLDENSSALALVDRTLIIFLVLVAMFTLGSWIY